MAQFGQFRSKTDGNVYRLPLSYSKPSHPFYDNFDLLPEDYEYKKAVAEVPSHDAKKADWVDYADSQGVDTTDLTKDQIIEAVEKGAE